MAYCIKCGASVPDECKFCPECGAEIVKGEASNPQPPQNDQNQQYSYGQGGDQNQQYSYGTDNGDQNQYNDQNQNYNAADYFDPAEVKKNKGMGVLAYLGILVLIPLLAGDKNSAYVKHHSNQGLVLFLISLVTDCLSGNIAYGFVTFWHLGGIWSTLFDVVDLAIFILMIVGIVSACKGDKREIPILSKIKILK